MKLSYFTEAFTKNYFNFKGRSRRAEFWTFTLINCIIFFILSMILSVIAPNLRGYGNGLTLFILVIALIMLAMSIPSIAMAVRRLHDTGRSGWWELLGFLPLANIALIVILTLDSQPGTNKWGPNPKQQDVLPGMGTAVTADW